jgi:pyruvate-formate lyase
MRMTAEQVGRLYRITGDDCSFNLLSPLYDDCLKRGKALLDGGVRGLDATVEVYGLVNTADSLLAIKKLVYEDKVLTPEQMLAILDADFAGYEKERKMMLDVPKFGNDLDEPDEMMERVHEQACFAAMAQSGKYGLGRYLIVNINNNVNTLWGRWTPASPDGRKSGKPMSNGNNPSSGMDVNGLTAFLNSLLRARTDIHAGVVQNMKFSKEMFNEKRAELEHMLGTYFKSGGTQAMLTVVGREELENARKHPEQYGNLLVRVGGFSARYVELDEDVQIEILDRTIY